MTSLPNNHFAVSVPEGAKELAYELFGHILSFYVGRVGSSGVESVTLPPGSYTIVGLAKDLTEAQRYPLITGFEKLRGCPFDNTPENLEALLLSLSLDKNVLIIKQNK